MDYYIGDIVISKIPVGNKRLENAVGIILDIQGMILVEFNQNIGGHDGDGKGEYGYCWYLFDDELEPYTDYFPGDVVIPVNDYSKACFHCREGGIVDTIAKLTESLLICPTCGRICNGKEVE